MPERFPPSNSASVSSCSASPRWKPEVACKFKLEYLTILGLVWFPKYFRRIASQQLCMYRISEAFGSNIQEGLLELGQCSEITIIIPFDPHAINP